MTVYERIVKETLAALKFENADGGLIVLLDGFFVYEMDRNGCRSIVAPHVEDDSIYLVRVTKDGRLWHHLFMEVAEHTPRPGPVSILLDRPPSPAREAQHAMPELANVQWLPDWSADMKAGNLPRAWRDRGEPPLHLDLTCSGGVLTALADRYTVAVTFKQGKETRRTSTVGAYVVLGQGAAYLEQDGVSFETPFGNAPGAWTVIAITHRQFRQSDETTEEATARIGAAHDKAIVKMYGRQPRNPRVEAKLKSDPLPGYPYGQEETIEQVLREALSPVGVSLDPSRRAIVTTIFDGGQPNCRGSRIPVEPEQP